MTLRALGVTLLILATAMEGVPGKWIIQNERPLLRR